MEAWSLDGMKLIRQTEAASTIQAEALSPDGTHLAIATGPNSPVLLWDPEREEKPHPLPGPPNIWWKLLFSHDGKRLIAAGGDWDNGRTSGALWVWDVATARLVHKVATKSIPGHLLLTADDRVLIASILDNGAGVSAWDMETGAELARLSAPSGKHPGAEGGPRSQPAITGLALSADERFLAVVSGWDDVSAVSIWETGTWKRVRAFAPTPPRNDVKAMVFSRDGRSLFVANGDSTILEWDLTGRRPDGRWHDKALTPHELETCWTALAGKDAAKAYDAVWSLVASPEQAVAFLHKHLSAAPQPDAERVARLLSELDSDDFMAREHAAEELSKLGYTILPHLRRMLEGKLSLEARRRVQQLLDQARDRTPEQLRDHRAIQALEHIGTPEARQLLEVLAGGFPDARRTKEARAALRFLGR